MSEREVEVETPLTPGPAERPKTSWNRFKQDLRGRLVTGILVLLPLSFTYLLLRFLFLAFAAIPAPLLKMIGRQAWPDWAVNLFSILLILITIYVAGLLATHLIGRKMIAWTEAVIARIPLVNTVYATAKQVVDSLRVTQKRAFQKVVLVHYPSAGCRAIGFVTGSISGENGRLLYKVFIPTAPNPTSGFLYFSTPEETEETDLTVEQAIKMIVSGGIIAPAELKIRPPED